MPTNIFLTGVTGYIGGDIAYVLQQKHPDYDYTFLVRNEERAKPVRAQHPNAKLVFGSLDDSAVIEKAASEADIVIHTADSADNVPSAQAIAKGLEAGHTAQKPGYWIHISGTGELIWRDSDEKRFGQAPYPDENYDDVAGIDKVLSLPDHAIHRNVDKLVLAANSSAVRTAIVSPPTIYGSGRGPVNTRSMQVPAMVKFSLQNGFAPVIEPGLTEWDHVNVHDLADLVTSLVDAAQEPRLAEDPEVFGGHGYYFAEAGSHRWSDVARWIADELVKQRFTAEAKVEVTNLEGAVEKAGRIAGSWALNSKSFATRARKYLGWKPTHQSLKEAIPDTVSSEAKRLEIEPHAA